MAHSQPAWLYTSKPVLKKLSSTLLGTLSSTVPIALDDTPSLLDCTLTSKLSRCSQVHRVRSEVHSQACSQWHSQLHSLAHSQPAWLYTPKPALKKVERTLPSMLSSMLPIALDGTLPAYLALRSQVHSQEGRHSQSHLTIYSHVPSCKLDPETCWVAETRRQEAWGRWHMVGSVWWAACGMWCVADGGRRMVAESSWRSMS